MSNLSLWLLENDEGYSTRICIYVLTKRMGELKMINENGALMWGIR